MRTRKSNCCWWCRSYLKNKIKVKIIKRKFTIGIKKEIEVGGSGCGVDFCFCELNLLFALRQQIERIFQTISKLKKANLIRLLLPCRVMHACHHNSTLSDNLCVYLGFWLWRFMFCVHLCKLTFYFYLFYFFQKAVEYKMKKQNMSTVGALRRKCCGKPLFAFIILWRFLIWMCGQWGLHKKITLLLCLFYKMIDKDLSIVVWFWS